VNLAIQDAVAAANILVPKLKAGRATPDDLRAVQQRRESPTVRTQRLQVFLQNRIISPVIGRTAPFKPPWALRLLDWLPMLRRIPARIIGMGFRPEHINH
jgi:2-polyprenyl-6-methoxyphenol hydroxylase-like FAD-dependent oxidoreductase